MPSDAMMKEMLKSKKLLLLQVPLLFLKGSS
jgi:hypothetical protein